MRWLKIIGGKTLDASKVDFFMSPKFDLTLAYLKDPKVIHKLFQIPDHLKNPFNP